jgi:hypothetical protein
MREYIADIIHFIWSSWASYLLSKCHIENNKYIIPAELVSQYKKQIKTKYSDLPISERESDLCHADRLWYLVKRRLDE